MVSSPATPLETIAIIPARGGSKGVPRKNIRPLGGRPLIAWSIEAARLSGVVDRVYVSTDDEEIADIARRWGAEVPFLRPAELAQDRSIVGEAVSWTLRELTRTGRQPWATYVLYPTHPFRTRRMFTLAQRALREGHRLFATASEVEGGLQYCIAREGRPEPFSSPLAGLADGPYRRYLGLLSATRYGQYSGNDFIHTVHDPVQLIDLDSEDDFRLAEAVLERGLYRFGDE